MKPILKNLATFSAMLGSLLLGLLVAYLLDMSKYVVAVLVLWLEVWAVLFYLQKRAPDKGNPEGSN